MSSGGWGGRAFTGYLNAATRNEMLHVGIVVVKSVTREPVSSSCIFYVMLLGLRHSVLPAPKIAA